MRVCFKLLSIVKPLLHDFLSNAQTIENVVVKKISQFYESLIGLGFVKIIFFL